MAKCWSDKEVSKLHNLISEFGRAEGLQKFSYETGRSVDSARRKLLRLKEALDSDEVPTEDTEETITVGSIPVLESDTDLPEEVVPDRFKEDYADTEKNSTFFERLRYYIFG